MAVDLVDHIGVAVLVSTVFDEVRMIGWQIGMLMRDFGRIVLGPAPQGECDTGHSEGGKREKRGGHPEPGAKLTGNRVGKQPANMAQGELGGEQGRTIWFGGGSPEQTSAGGYTERIAYAHDQPAGEQDWPI